MKTLSKTLVVAATAVGLAGGVYAQAQHQGHGSMPMGNMPMMGQMDPAAMQKMMQA